MSEKMYPIPFALSDELGGRPSTPQSGDIFGVHKDYRGHRQEPAHLR